MKEWVNRREEVTRATAREFIVSVRRVLTEKGINLDLGYRDINRVMVTEHVHESPLAPHSVPHLGGDRDPLRISLLQVPPNTMR